MADVRRTACNRDCPDTCSLLVTVEAGRATRLRGDPVDPVTRGFLCERTGRFLHRQYAADRFLRPMVRRRRGGDLEPIGWDAALDLAAERLLRLRDESGPASILHYRSGGSLGILKSLADHLFERFGPVSIKRGDICSGAGEAAQELDFGTYESHDLFDLHNSAVVLVWGKNVHTSSVHMLPVLREARKRDAVIVGIDPVRTRLAELCDLFVRPRPGADYALAMGVARRLFEEGWVDPAAGDYCDHLGEFRGLAHERSVDDWARAADVDPDDLRRVAELYGTRAPGAILVGWGLARRRNGAATVRALDALGAVRGNIGVAGGGVSYSMARRRSFDLDFVRGAEVAPRTFPESRLGPTVLAATDPPVRMIWVTAGNPVSMLPDALAVGRAFERTDFAVVVDTHPTDTTDRADLVLPTLTLLEDSDVLGAYGNHWLRLSEAALDPPGDDGEGPRHELHILQGLARRLGLADALAGTVDDWRRRVTRSLERGGAGIDAVREGPVRNPSAPEVLFAERRFPTATGRVNLLREAAGPPPEVSAELPLTLLAVSTPKAQSSQSSVEPPPGPAEVRVHPDAAGGLRDGDRARLRSRHGELPVVVRLDDAVRPDVALMAKGGMLRDGRCANVLIPAVETDLGGGASYYDEPVRLVAE